MSRRGLLSWGLWEVFGQDRVDRRFNRSRCDAEHEVSRFAERLRNEVELGVVARSTAALWLRESGR